MSRSKSGTSWGSAFRNIKLAIFFFYFFPFSNQSSICEKKQNVFLHSIPKSLPSAVSLGS
uniref:Uncharacterized protein n=1 Tax=Anguilla anguilla TaxID=7936 RepID=A0A0E9XSI3_ANGAN